MTQDSYRVAVVDDDPAVLRSVARLLKAHDYAVAAYDSPTVLLAELKRWDPICIVADLSMPEMTGLDLQQALAGSDTEYALVFITGRGDIPSTVRAMRAGAIDFLTKPFDAGALLESVRRGIDACQAERERCMQLSSIRERVASLTPRERVVFEHVISGLLNKQIAHQLGISEETVKVHRGRVMQKMAARSVAEFARSAERIGITDR